MYDCFLAPLSLSLFSALFSCLPPEPESWLCLAKGVDRPPPLLSSVFPARPSDRKWCISKRPIPLMSADRVRVCVMDV